MKHSMRRKEKKNNENEGIVEAKKQAKREKRRKEHEGWDGHGMGISMRGRPDLKGATWGEALETNQRR